MEPRHCCRIDLGDLKALIVKKLGLNNSKQYFYYLNRFLSQKLSKKEFDKSCIRVLGRENIELHNQFVQSILKNACLAKTPPPLSKSSFSKSNAPAASSFVGEEGCEQRGGILPNHSRSIPIRSNGFVPPPSRKIRSMTHDQKLKDRPGSFGPMLKVDYASQRIAGAENSRKVGVDNGTLIPCDYQRPLQHLQSVAAELPEHNLEGSAFRPAKEPRINNESQIEAALVEDGEEPNKFKSFRRPLLAPLGIPVWSAGIGGPHKSMPMVNSIDFPSFFNSGGLFDAETLRKRMEQIAISEGLGGVSTECGNVLNNAIDVYLKGLVRSCVELVGARSTCQLRRNPTNKQQMQGKPINGIWPNNHLHMQNGSEPANVLQKQRPQYSISLLDFKVAMELNPEQLGGDWPLRLEKICMHPYEQ